MTTIKSYTDINQSKKLAEILPLESADMRYEYPSREKDEIQEPMNGFHISSFNWFKESDSFIYFPCWSLAALLSVLNFPSLTQNKEDEWEVCVPNHKSDEYIEVSANNPVNACYEMILKLHELNLL